MEIKTMQKVISLSAGPGSGKSTTAALIFGKLKLMGHNVELVREYAKDLTWEGNMALLEDQRHVYEEQKRRMDILVGKVDIIITDSSLFLSNIYNPNAPAEMKKEVIDSYFSYDVEEYFITRTKAYNPSGRNQTESEAKDKDKEIIDYMLGNAIPFTSVHGNAEAADVIINHALDKWKAANKWKTM